MDRPTRDEAYELLRRYVNDDSLIKHALAVEAVMGHFAEKFDEDVEKWKQKSFAAGVDREVIQNGANMLEMELSEVIEETIAGMQKVADEIGLRGEL